jgi:hypothetical protein
MAVESATDFIARKQPELLHRPVYAKDIGRSGRVVWRREQLTMRQQHNEPLKVYLVERLRLERFEGEQFRSTEARVGDVQIRFGYHTVSRTGKWWWGQYAPFIPEADLQPLLSQAVADGTIVLDCL